MYRAAFLEEGLAVDAVGPAHQGHRPIGEVRHHDGADPRVVVDDLGLREPGLGVEDLVEVRQPQPPALDLNLATRLGAHGATGESVRRPSTTCDAIGAGGRQRRWAWCPAPFGAGTSASVS